MIAGEGRRSSARCQGAATFRPRSHRRREDGGEDGGGLQKEADDLGRARQGHYQRGPRHALDHHAGHPERTTVANCGQGRVLGYFRHSPRPARCKPSEMPAKRAVSCIHHCRRRVIALVKVGCARERLASKRMATIFVERQAAK